MKRNGGKSGIGRAFPVVLAAAGVLAVPVAGTAAVGSLIPAVTTFDSGYVPFTPANIDPALARKVAATLGLEGLRFTPAPRARAGRARGDDGGPGRSGDRARDLGSSFARRFRSRPEGRCAVGGSAYCSRPLQSRQRARFPDVRCSPRLRRGGLDPAGTREIAIADFPRTSYRYPARRASRRASSRRLLSRISTDAGRSPRTWVRANNRSRSAVPIALSRTSRDRRRARLAGSQPLTPLTDGVADDKAVYVGTQFKF